MSLAKEAARFVVSPKGTAVDVKTLKKDSPTRVFQESMDKAPPRKKRGVIEVDPNQVAAQYRASQSR